MMQRHTPNTFKLVIIRPIGRSGSIFLQSLFDNHPEILSFPMVFPFYLHWRVFSRFENLTIDGLINYFIDETHLKHLFPNATNLPQTLYDEKGNKTHFRISKKTFVRNLKKELRESVSSFPSRKEFLIALHRAYAKTATITLSDKKVILVHEHGSYSYQDPNEDFDDVVNIVTTREPRNSYASFIGYRQRLGSAFATFYNILDLNGWVDGFVNATIYARRFPDNIIFVKTEDLNTNPKKEMQRLIRKIGIRYDKFLLKSTYAGYSLVLGFSSVKSEKKGFDSKGMSENRWQSLCSEREIKIIDALFRQKNLFFGYNTSLPKFEKYKTVLTILKPDLRLLRLRYKKSVDILQYIFFLHPIWMRLCFLRGLFMIDKARGDTYIELPLLRTRFFAIALYKFRLKSLLKIRG